MVVIVVVGGEVVGRGLGVVEHGEGEVDAGALLVGDGVLLVLEGLLVHAHVQVRAKGKAVVVVVGAAVLGVVDALVLAVVSCLLFVPVVPLLALRHYERALLNRTPHWLLRAFIAVSAIPQVVAQNWLQVLAASTVLHVLAASLPHGDVEVVE